MALDLKSVAERIEAFRMTDPNLNLCIGLGVIGLPADGQTSWFVARYDKGACRDLSEAVVPTDALLADELPDVQVGISASETVWETIRDGGERALRDASASLHLKVAGDAPLFIAKLDKLKALLLGAWA